LSYSCQSGLSIKHSHGDWFRTIVEQIIAATALIILAIPIALTMIITWCTIGRPILFWQQRVGLNMQTFTICKFRTMRDFRDGSGRLLPDHDRETSASRFMRRTRLDEFPQLFAILSGKMAFIGPRPLLPKTIEEMGKLGKLRCRVRPGLTGWAQINGNTKLSDAQKLAFDIWYIDHRSFKIDTCILLKTITTLVDGESIKQYHLAQAQLYVDAKYGSTQKITLDDIP
jgi:lipopolysaccharide/colanic/teichoic acid biosynthesis glycosyltransferase